jgi:hypothetical protein
MSSPKSPQILQDWEGGRACQRQCRETQPLHRAGSATGGGRSRCSCWDSPHAIRRSDHPRGSESTALRLRRRRPRPWRILSRPRPPLRNHDERRPKNDLAEATAHRDRGNSESRLERVPRRCGPRRAYGAAARDACCRYRHLRPRQRGRARPRGCRDQSGTFSSHWADYLAWMEWTKL